MTQHNLHGGGRGVASVHGGGRGVASVQYANRNEVALNF